MLIAVASLLIVAFILNTAPGYRRDKMEDITNLVIHDVNVTEELKEKIYINENGSIYLSKEDVKNLFDNTIYYDKQLNQIITTSDTKVANIPINKKEMIVNDSQIQMLEPVIKKGEIIYIPIAEMGLIYNIKVDYIQKSDIVIIEDLSKGLTIATVSSNLDIKFRPRTLSKTIGKLEKGQTVSCFYITSKGWRQIRTDKRNIRIYKSK